MRLLAVTSSSSSSLFLFFFFGWNTNSSFWEPVLEYYFFKTRNVVCTNLKNLCDQFWKKTLITAVGLGKITYDFDSVSNGNCRTHNLEFLTVIFCISNIPQGNLEQFLSLWDIWWINIDNINCCTSTGIMHLVLMR